MGTPSTGTWYKCKVLGEMHESAVPKGMTGIMVVVAAEMIVMVVVVMMISILVANLHIQGTL